jgi:hypothetical protein
MAGAGGGGAGGSSRAADSVRTVRGSRAADSVRTVLGASWESAAVLALSQLTVSSGQLAEHRTPAGHRGTASSSPGGGRTVAPGFSRIWREAEVSAHEGVAEEDIAVGSRLQQCCEGRGLVLDCSL